MNDKFITLNQQVYDYVLRHRSRSALDEVLDELRAETDALGGIAAMQISADQGAFFSLIVAATGAKSAIEIGTFTGYSSLCIAQGLGEGGKLLCLDQNEEWTNVARRYWQRAGLDSRIELRLGDAKSTLRGLTEAEQFDFAFVDADKTGYDEYYELLLPRLKPNTLIVFDNMLRGGRIANDVLEDESEKALDALNKKLANDPRVESVLLPFADGLNFCRKKPAEPRV
jgi:caffeoyl-CoA O-methyltransferase